MDFSKEKLSIKKLGTKVILSTLLSTTLFFGTVLGVSATDFQAEAEARKELPVESNEIESWPDGPLIGAEAAILIEANTGTILYAKNISKKEYPASITKLLTSLIAIENSNLDDIITFSHDAVFSVPSDASGMGMDVGEQITMEQALYGTLVGSANEAANAIGEHVSGSLSAFADLMNQRATQLGCLNSNFVTSNGLFDDNHYTTAYDMAIIAKEFFSYELLSKMSNTERYNIPISATQPDDIWVYSHNRLLAGRQFEFEYFIGGKTGYTDIARQTLVSCAEKDGMRLICVILKEESPAQFTDTVDLFNYGFSNFQMLNIAENETQFNIEHSDFFESNTDVFGNSEPILSLNQESFIILPVTAEFSDTVSTLSYDTKSDTSVAEITYTYQNVLVGTVTVDLASSTTEDIGFDSIIDDPETDLADFNSSEETIHKVIFVNVKKIIFWILGIAGFVIILFIIRAIIRNYHFSRRRRIRLRHKKRRQHKSKYDRYDF